jgi:uncharacterized protein
MTASPSSNAPLDIDIRALAQQHPTLQGRAPLSHFERVTEGLPPFDEAASGLASVPVAEVQWSARAESREPLGGKTQWWLHLQLSAAVPQTCQRCMGAYLESVEVDRWFRFVNSEATALAEDDDCEEDLLVWAQPFDLFELIEDELLMALPLVPMHSACPVAVPMQAGDDVLDAVEPAHPFAALAALKTGVTQEVPDPQPPGARPQKGTT